MKSVINPRQGVYNTVRSHYYKAGVMNFLPIRGGQVNFAGDLETAICEIYEHNNKHG